MESQIVHLEFPGELPERLDKFLVRCLPDISRTRLQSLIKQELVWVDGYPATKSGQVLDRPCRIELEIPPPSPSDLVPEAIPLDIVFENADLLVINKAAGLVVHPAAGHSSGTLVHAVLAYAPDLQGIGGQQRPGIVHRLDKGTSGLLLVAKNERAHQYLQDQFRLHRVEKIYTALVDGHPPTPAGRIEAAIGRDTKNRKLMAAVSAGKGRQAISEYRTLEAFPDHTLLEVHPITGRTHQIRLHLAFIGCPVAGDTVYGRHHSSLHLNRHFLHAARLTLILPGKKTADTFVATLPDDLSKALGQLRRPF